MLDPDSFSQCGTVKRGDVTGGINIGIACAEKLINDNAVIRFKTRIPCQLRVGPDARLK